MENKSSYEVALCSSLPVLFVFYLLIACTLSIQVYAQSPASLSNIDSNKTERYKRTIDAIKNSNLSTNIQKIDEYKTLLVLIKADKLSSDALLFDIHNHMLRLMLDIGAYSEISDIYQSLTTKLNNVPLPELASNLVNITSHAANAFMMQEEFNKAKPLVLRNIIITEQMALLPSTKAYAQMTAAQYYIRTSQFKQGLDMLSAARQSYQDSTSLSSQEKEQKIASNLSFVGNTYYTLGDYDNAIKYWYISLEWLGESAPLIEKVTLFVNIASTQLELGNSEQAITLATQSIEMSEKINSKFYMAFSNEILAKAKYQANEYNDALQILLPSYAYFKTNNYVSKEIDALTLIAKIHIANENWRDGKNTVEEVLRIAAEINTLDALSADFYYVQYLVEEHNDNLAKALQAYRAYSESEIAALELKRAQETQRLMLDFELDIAEKEASRLAKDNELKTIIIESNATKTDFLIAIIIGVTALVMMLVIIYKREHDNKLEMKKLAMTDPLTGCANRRKVLDYAGQMLRVANFADDNLCIALIDVDNFKLINDTYGHEAGDSALKGLASTINQNLRGSDLLGRYGGEEFVLVLPKSRKDTVEIVFNRLQKSLEQHSFKYGGETINMPVTVCMGAVLVPKINGRISNEDLSALIDDIIAQADIEVYAGKHNGKNQLNVVALDTSDYDENVVVKTDGINTSKVIG